LSSFHNIPVFALLISASIIYLFSNKAVNSHLNQAVKAWSDIIRISAMVTVSLLAAFALTTFGNSTFEVAFSHEEEWYFIISGLALSMFWQGALVKLAVLAYVTFRLTSPEFSFQSSSSLLLFSLASLATNLDSHNKLAHTVESQITSTYLNLISLFSISCISFTLMNFDLFVTYTTKNYGHLFDIHPQTISLILIASLVAWMVNLLVNPGRALLSFSTIPTAFIIQFVFPQDPVVLPVILGSIIGLIINPIDLKKMRNQYSYSPKTINSFARTRKVQ
jgi:hypothetical protein